MTTEEAVGCLAFLLGPPIVTIIGWAMWFRADHKRHMARRKREYEAWESHMKNITALVIEGNCTLEYRPASSTETRSQYRANHTAP